MQPILNRHVVVDGVRIAYSDSGAGEPVVLIHGTPSHAYIWRNVVPGLEAAGYNVLVFDLLGYGQSERPSERDASVAGQARILAQLLDAWDLDQARLVGHDIGGAVAMIFATRGEPDRVRSLSLIDTVSYDSWPSENTWQGVTTDQIHQYEQMSITEFREMMARQLRMTVYNKERMSGDVLETYLAPLVTELGKLSYFIHQVRNYDSRYTEDIVDDMKRLAMPVQILWGEEDEWQSVNYAYRLRDDIPNATLTVVPQAGHFLMEDAPERVVAELTSFFNSEGA